MPFHRDHYSDDWEEISTAIRERSGGCCECLGECGLHRTHPGPRRCEERNGEKAKWARGKIVLTVAHMDHDTMNNDAANLRAMCQRCHLRYDHKHHMQNAAITRRRQKVEAGQSEMEL